MFRLLKIAALCILVPVKLSSQAGGPCQEHTADVSVLDENGHPLKNLTSQNFRASIHGKSVGITSSEYREHKGNRIIVLLDASGSMLGKWTRARTAVMEVVSSAPADAQVSLIVFAAKVEQQFDASGGRQPIEDWLNAASTRELTNVRGKTALYHIIIETVKGLGPTQPGDAIYVITDGGENGGSEFMGSVERSLQFASVRLFVLLLDDAPLRSEEEEHGVTELFEMTQRTGGLLVSVNPYAKRSTRTTFGDDWLTQKIRSATNSILAGVSGYYVVTLSAPSGDVHNWQLKVVDDKGRERKHLNVAYPHNLADCMTSTSVR
jgi:hypothetical protein